MMGLPPLTRNYFSSHPSRELFWRWFLFIVVIGIVLILYLFWYPLRNTEFAYSLVSITIRNTSIRIFFKAVTTLGSEGFFLVALSIIYWSVNKSMGFWCLMVMPLSIFLTSEIPKDIIKLPRPDIKGVSMPTYTFPSGHVSGAVSVWGYLAVRIQKCWLWIGALLVIVLVGLSRIMLGYHFPGDILGGIVAGIMFLFLFFELGVTLIEKRWDRRMHPALLKFIALVVPLLLSYVPASFAPNLMGYMAGTGLGYLFQKEKLNFSPRGRWQQHLIRILIGAAVLAVVIPGLNTILPSNVHLLTFTQYAFATFWTTYLAPLAFLKLRLV